MGTKHDWTQAIHVIRFIDTCKYSAYLRTMYDQERHVHVCQYKFTRERLVTTFNEYLALPAFALLQGRTRAPTAAARPTGPTRASDGRYRSNDSTRRSSGTQRSPRSGDRNVRSLEEESVNDGSADGDADQLTDDDDSSLVMHAMTAKCILCDQTHEPYCCPCVVGDVAAQRKVFANLRQRRSTSNVRMVDVEPSSDNDTDLLDLGSDFP